MSYNRRYYLHKRIRKAGLTLNTREKLISAKAEQTEVAQIRKYITELSDKYNYGIQFTNPILDL
jgi:hypothetical protein